MKTVPISPKELDEKAFKLLPHIYIYDAQRKVIGIIDYPDDPGWTYERFCVALDVYIQEDNQGAIKQLGRELEKIENGIGSLVTEVGDFKEPEWLVEGVVVRKGLTIIYGDSGGGKTTFTLYMTD
jgi:hypothetical protein